MRKAIALVLLLLVAGGVAHADQCSAGNGMHVTLFGGVDDPDVLVWDSRARLMSYSSGSSDARKFLLPHALLTRPGTKAKVVSCYAGLVHSKFRLDAEDAVGVLILSGKYRGRYGWVSSGDIHGRGIPEAREPW
jgi:hypothetical protein